MELDVGSTCSDDLESDAAKLAEIPLWEIPQPSEAAPSRSHTTTEDDSGSPTRDWLSWFWAGVHIHRAQGRCGALEVSVVLNVVDSTGTG